MNDAMRVRDEWLALRWQAGVPGAFEDLLAELERPLFYYAVKLTGSNETALEVLQEVWIRALKNVSKLRQPCTVRPWLYAMVHGIAVDDMRKERSRQRMAQEHAVSFQEDSDPWPSVDDAAIVHDALDNLDAKHREVLVLHFLEDFSVGEIAVILGTPQGTVKSRMHYAKKAIKEAISRRKQ